jgi:hypothetical protein
VVVARWLSPKAQSRIAPPIPEQIARFGTLQVLRLRKPDAPPTTYVVSWFGLPNRTFVRSSSLNLPALDHGRDKGGISLEVASANLN